MALLLEIVGECMSIVVIGGAGLFGEKFASKLYRKRDGGLRGAPTLHRFH